MEAASVQRVSPAGVIPLRLRSDAALARAAAAGQEEAFAAIFRRYQQPLYRYCCSLLRSEADAADALQNTMLAAMRSLPGETRPIELKPWLYRVAHNESISLMRRRRPQEELDERCPALSGDPATSAEQRADFDQLMSDLGELSQAQRSALLLRELSGLSHEEIASVFEISLSAAKQSIHKARLSLQGMVEGREMHCEEIRRMLSERDGRLVKGRGIRSHLRSCSRCEDFNSAIAGRGATLQAVMPVLGLPAAGEMLASVFGGAAQGSSSGGLGAMLGAGEVAGSSAAVKALAVGAAAVTIAAGGIGASVARDSAEQRADATREVGPSVADTTPNASVDVGRHDTKRTAARGTSSPGRSANAKGLQANGAAGATSPLSGQGPAIAPHHATEPGAGGEAGSHPPTPSAPPAPATSPPGSPETGTEHSQDHMPDAAPVPPRGSQQPAAVPTSPPSTPAPPVSSTPLVELPPVPPGGGDGAVGPGLPGARP